MPPAHIRNAPTRLMKDLGYGKHYKYDPDTPEGFSGQNYFPEGVSRPTFYEPREQGAEARVKERLQRWAALRGG
jgi:putative ATPase